MNQGGPVSASLLRNGKRAHGVDASYFLHPDHASMRVTGPIGTPQQQHYREPEDPYDLGVEAYSIGNLSIGPGPSMANVPSAEADKRKSVRTVRSVRSMRSLKSLGFKSSRDSLHEPAELKVRRTKRGKENLRERLVIGVTTPPESPLKASPTMSRDGVPSSVPWETPIVPDRRSSMQSANSPRKLYWNANDIAGNTSNIKGEHNIPELDHIPARDSSKRHSLGMGSSHRRRLSKQSEPSSVRESEQESLESHSNSLKQALQEVHDDPAGDVVSRRIKELKDQKLKRERSSMEEASGFLTAPETPIRTLSPSPSVVTQKLVAVTTSSVEETRLAVDVEKANLAENNEESAPSPAIAQRAKRSSGIYAMSTGTQATADKEPPVNNKNDIPTRSVTSPQRSNSRLLRRLSQHGNPATAGKHRRTYSNPLTQQMNRNTSYQTENIDPIEDEVHEYIVSSRLNQKIRHSRTGRTISFSEVGDPQGSAVFCCVGMGLTRFLTAFYDELASTLKLRLITPDRPGVGGSEAHADGSDTPLVWPDDVRAICEYLKITKFSIMAHSAGAIYALATALRMPQHIRCRVHLLAPWIPPSQMSSAGAQQEPLPASALPYSQRFLRALPTTFLRAANSNFLSTTSASITTSLPKSPRRASRRTLSRNEASAADIHADSSGDRNGSSPSPKARRGSVDPDYTKENAPSVRRGSITANSNSAYEDLSKVERKSKYDARLTEAIWEAATTGANPAVDLLVCLERRQPIGFRYVDITRAVVIHHGSKDTRVPVENVKWLGKTMRRCEVRILEGEGHGLMASAMVMSNVLMEIAQEWDDWNRVVKGKGGTEGKKTTTTTP